MYFIYLINKYFLLIIFNMKNKRPKSKKIINQFNHPFFGLLKKNN